MQVPSRSKGSGNCPVIGVFWGFSHARGNKTDVCGSATSSRYARVARPKESDQLRQWTEYRIEGDHAHTWHCRAPSETKGDAGSPFPHVVTRN